MLRIIFYLLLFTSSASHAGMLVKNYEKMKNNDLVKLYIYGVGEGYSWSNASLSNKNQAPLYCQPKKMILNNENYLTLLDTSIRESTQGNKDELIVEALLLTQLIKVFPCN